MTKDELIDKQFNKLKNTLFGEEELFDEEETRMVVKFLGEFYEEVLKQRSEANNQLKL
jgi:hypothetical protein